MAELIQRSFTSGEISPAVQSRADITKYATGLNLCKNFFVRAQGGVYSRPGLKFIEEIGDSTQKGRLIPFSFNTEQTYILVFEQFKIRILVDGEYVESSPGVTLVIASPYTAAQLPRLAYTQNADVLTITHPDHDPRNLNRLSATSWTLDEINFAPVVEIPQWETETVYPITSITNTNPAVVTFSALGLTDNDMVLMENMVGMTELEGKEVLITVVDPLIASPTEFYITGFDATLSPAFVSGDGRQQRSFTPMGVPPGSSDSKQYYWVVTAVDQDGVESLPSLVNSLFPRYLSVSYGARMEWVKIDTADYYRVYKDSSDGSGFFGWIGDTKNNFFTDYNLAPITSDAPPADRQPFAGVDNKPATVEYYQQRQVFANTNNEPQVTYTTQTGNFNSFRTSNPARDDDAVTFTIAAKQVNEIRHLVSLDSLILLTSGSEWIVSEGQNRVLTPSTIGVRTQSYNGSSWVKPVVINSTALYVQEKGTRVRDLAYEFSSDKYTGNDLSIMAEHLFEDHQIVEMVYADEPYGILWCVRDDGVMLGLTYLREHQVWGWHQHETDGVFESVATINEDGRDAVYVIVKRTIGGVTRRYIERMEKREVLASEDCFYLDSGRSYNGAPATVFSGLDHLEGKTVSILGDGNVFPDQIVTGGAVTLESAVSKAHIGLPYLPVIETLDIDVSTASETVKADNVSVSKVFIEVEKTRGGFVGPRQDSTSSIATVFREIKPRFDVDDYDSLPLRTYKQEVVIEPQWSKGGGLRIEQRVPLPMAILSVIPKVDIGGN